MVKEVHAYIMEKRKAVIKKLRRSNRMKGEEEKFVNT
jgi:hypothetical protein